MLHTAVLDQARWQAVDQTRKVVSFVGITNTWDCIADCCERPCPLLGDHPVASIGTILLVYRMVVENGDFPTEMLEMLVVFIPGSHESAIKDIWHDIYI